MSVARAIQTLEDERPLSIEIDVVACGVVDPPGIVDPVHLRSPDVAASRSGLVRPDHFGLASLETADGFGACDADVGPGRGQEVVVAVARVDDEGIRAISCV